MKRKQYRLSVGRLLAREREENESLREELKQSKSDRALAQKELRDLCGVPPWASSLFVSVNRIVEAVDNLAGFINNEHAQRALREYDAKMKRAATNVVALAKTTRAAKARKKGNR